LTASSTNALELDAVSVAALKKRGLVRIGCIASPTMDQMMALDSRQASAD
jgi:hypothetical protein